MKKYEYVMIEVVFSRLGENLGGLPELQEAGMKGFRVIQSSVVPLGGAGHKIVYLLERETEWKVGGPL